MKFTEVDNTTDLPDSTLRCWTTRDEVERYHPDADKVYVHSPDGMYSVYYVVEMER